MAEFKETTKSSLGLFEELLSQVTKKTSVSPIHFQCPRMTIDDIH